MSFLEVKDLKVHFPIHEGIFRRVVDHVKAVDGVSFNIEQGSTYGLVGESGSGKTTTGRAIIGLNEITSGQVLFEGEDITDISKAKSNIRKDIQIIFQDPFSSLNPKKRVLDIIAEPLRNFENLTAVDEFKRVLELLEIVGLASASILKYPHEFSGGQLQRIGIARVLALKPKVIIADEPVSALDVSIQAQVLNFMKELQKELNLTYLFISHDLGVIRYMCDEVAIMYRGRYVEQGNTEEIFENPQHIYTKRLVSAIPDLDPLKRDEQYKIRQTFKKEYDESHDLYFDEHGLATKMKPISPTHSAAIPSKGSD